MIGTIPCSNVLASSQQAGREVVLALWCLVQEAIWLEAGIDGYSLDAFKPASEHTYTIRVTPNIATGLTRPGPQDSGSLRQKLASVKT
ncbi:TPA: hypothetical protein ACH3X3_010421 [Trebouxia sp. C0006]